MKSVYFEDEDILEIRLSDEPIAREISPDWRTHISYAAGGSIVEIVWLDAAKQGLLPIEIRKTP